MRTHRYVYGYKDKKGCIYGWRGDAEMFENIDPVRSRGKARELVKELPGGEGGSKAQVYMLVPVDEYIVEQGKKTRKV